MAFFADTICILNLSLISWVKLYHFTKAYNWWWPSLRVWKCMSSRTVNLQCRPELGRSFQKKVYFKRKDQSRQGQAGKTSLSKAEHGGKNKEAARKREIPPKIHLTSLFHKTPEPVSNLPLDDLTQNRQRIREPELNTADPDKLTSRRWETPEKSASHALPAPMSKTSQKDKQGNKGK